mmetsp:Transcript_68280/g.119006  ORF Transcript_68280/g.119006 Transcript_68280/m.119006 type:complete len:767 (+) Transcript_68280:55-2355(+)
MLFRALRLRSQKSCKSLLGVFKRFDQSFLDQAEEDSFKHSLEKQLLPRGAVGAALLSLMIMAAKLPLFIRETCRTDQPFDWSSADPRSQCFVIYTALLVLAVTCAAGTILRLLLGCLEAKNWELTFLCVAGCNLVVLPFADELIIASVWGRRAEEIWQHGVEEHSMALHLIAPFVVVSYACLNMSCRGHVLWPLAICASVPFLILSVTVKSPQTQLRLAALAVIIFFHFCLCFSSATWKERQLRQAWSGLHRIQAECSAPGPPSQQGPADEHSHGHHTMPASADKASDEDSVPAVGYPSEVSAASLKNPSEASPSLKSERKTPNFHKQESSRSRSPVMLEEPPRPSHSSVTSSECSLRLQEAVTFDDIQPLGSCNGESSHAGRYMNDTILSEEVMNTVLSEDGLDTAITVMPHTPTSSGLVKSYPSVVSQGKRHSHGRSSSSSSSPYSGNQSSRQGARMGNSLTPRSSRSLSTRILHVAGGSSSPSTPRSCCTSRGTIRSHTMKRKKRDSRDSLRGGSRMNSPSRVPFNLARRRRSSTFSHFSSEMSFDLSECTVSVSNTMIANLDRAILQDASSQTEPTATMHRDAQTIMAPSVDAVVETHMVWDRDSFKCKRCIRPPKLPGSPSSLRSPTSPRSPRPKRRSDIFNCSQDSPSMASSQCQADLPGNLVETSMQGRAKSLSVAMKRWVLPASDACCPWHAAADIIIDTAFIIREDTKCKPDFAPLVGWQCKHCTVMCTAGVKKCVVCGHHREESRSPGSRSSNESP